MVVLTEHISDNLSIFQGKRDIQVGCCFPVGNSPLDVRRVEQLGAVCEWVEVFTCLEEWQILITELLSVQISVLFLQVAK